ncbi:MAG: hypothetical protein ACLGHC_02105 [Alphaproteobacteria bacterium]
MTRLGLAFAAALGVLASAPATAAPEIDADNPTCPKQLNWSTYRQMRFTLETLDGARILKAEGVIDDGVPNRLQEALKANDPVDEIWLRSPGGSARAGNAAGRIIRQAMLPTRIPQGWACFSACNFMFMGGPIRFVDDGGLFVVHMFTHLSDKEAVREEVARDSDAALEIIGEIEQDSALLATEDNDFLIRMGVSRKLLTDVMYQQKAIADGENKSTRRCLTPEETVKYNVANAR